MRIVVIGTSPKYLLNMRGELLKLLSTAGHEVIAMAAETSSVVVEELKELDIYLQPYPVQRSGMNPYKDLKTLFALRAQFRLLKPDVVLAYTIKPIIWGGIALRGMPGVKLYALVTGLGFAFQSTGGWRRALTGLVSKLYKIALSRSAGVIFHNPDDRGQFLKRCIVKPELCFVVNGSGVDVMRFSMMPIPSPLPDQGCVFLTIGRLLGEKGLREYVQARQIVKKHYPKAVFQLVGPVDPSNDGIPLREVEGWHEQGWVDYLGETKDVRPYLKNCHVYVQPSYHEGMPRTVLEAMAVGRPILTTDVPGCRETVIPGENGWLVPKANAGALAEQMIWFIENRQAWKNMGARSRQLAEEKFDVRLVNKHMMSIMKLI